MSVYAIRNLSFDGIWVKSEEIAVNDVEDATVYDTLQQATRAVCDMVQRCPGNQFEIVELELDADRKVLDGDDIRFVISKLFGGYDRYLVGASNWVSDIYNAKMFVSVRAAVSFVQLSGDDIEGVEVLPVKLTTRRKVVER